MPTATVWNEPDIIIHLLVLLMSSTENTRGGVS